MIESNLAVLLAERNIRISKIAQETGISRTTITSLCNDNSGGIKFDTLDTLCKYLQIEPSELFNFTAYEHAFAIEKRTVSAKERLLTYYLLLGLAKGKNKWGPVKFSVYTNLEESGAGNPVNVFVVIPDEETTNEEDVAFDHYNQFLNELSMRQQTNVKEEMCDVIKNQILQDAASDNELKKFINDDTVFIYNTEIF